MNNYYERKTKAQITKAWRDHTKTQTKRNELSTNKTIFPHIN